MKISVVDTTNLATRVWTRTSRVVDKTHLAAEEVWEIFSHNFSVRGAGDSSGKCSCSNESIYRACGLAMCVPTFCNGHHVFSFPFFAAAQQEEVMWKFVSK